MIRQTDEEKVSIAWRNWKSLYSSIGYKIESFGTKKSNLKVIKHETVFGSGETIKDVLINFYRDLDKKMPITANAIIIGSPPISNFEHAKANRKVLRITARLIFSKTKG